MHVLCEFSIWLNFLNDSSVNLFESWSHKWTLELLSIVDITGMTLRNKPYQKPLTILRCDTLFFKKEKITIARKKS
jgi:hypothetical protein